MKPTYLLATIVLFSGCTSADVTMDFDSDGDGLMDSLEVEYGTDPFNVDSDLDNYSDYQEIEAGTDPLSADDHPYLGGWPIDIACRDSIESTGNDEGQIASQFALVDQFGEEVDSFDFCNQTILIASGAFW